MYQDVFANCPKFNGISITEMHYCLCDIITSKYLEDKQYGKHIYIEIHLETRKILIMIYTYHLKLESMFYCSIWDVTDKDLFFSLTANKIYYIKFSNKIKVTIPTIKQFFFCLWVHSFVTNIIIAVHRTDHFLCAKE